MTPLDQATDDQANRAAGALAFAAGKDAHHCEWLRSLAHDERSKRLTIFSQTQSLTADRFEHVADRLDALTARVQELEGALRTAELAAWAVSGSPNTDLAAALPAIQAALKPKANP